MADTFDPIDDVVYRTIFEQVRLPMVVVEDDTTIVLCNPAFVAWSGLPRESIEGKESWTRFVSSPAELERMRDYHRRRRADPSAVPAEYEFEFVDVQGRRRAVALSVAMLPGSTRSIAVWQDISQQRQSEVWYKAVFENTGLPSAIIDETTLIVKANTAWALLTGYAVEENEGKMSWTSFVHEDDLPRMREYHANRRAGLPGVPRRYEFRARDRNGDIHYIINSVTMIPGTRYSIASLLDITELKDAEAERKRLGEQLLEARKLESMGHLAGVIAHDFNNMLSAILGYSDLMRRQLGETYKAFAVSSSALENVVEVLSGAVSTAETATLPVAALAHAAADVRGAVQTTQGRGAQLQILAGMMDEIVKASLTARDMTRQLLAFARKQTLEMRVLYLGDVIRGFEAMLRRTVREDVELQLCLSGEQNPIEGDAGQLEQVLLILVVNAQDAMPSGGNIVLRTENIVLDEEQAKRHAGTVPGPYVMLSVSDSGHGMTPEVKSQIFEPFFTTKSDGKGTGLGLATVYGIVKQHLGTIWLDSEPGRGTVFHMCLPQVKRAPETVRGNENAPSAGGSETVLVVEDQELVRKLTCIMLKQHGYEVLEAENARRALELVRQRRRRLDLLITDVVLPGMNGKELFDELRQTLPNLRALFTSGYPQDIIVHQGVDLERLDFLPKPVRVDELIPKVREILDRR